jgi:hypothetical protein
MTNTSQNLDVRSSLNVALSYYLNNIIKPQIIHDMTTEGTAAQNVKAVPNPEK